jgi:hypothetical protein
LFEAFGRLPVAVAVAAFGYYPLFVAAWEAASGQSAAGAAGLGMAVVVIIGLVLLMRPDPSVSAPAAGLLLALLAAGRWHRCADCARPPARTAVGSSVARLPTAR